MGDMTGTSARRCPAEVCHRTGECQDGRSRCAYDAPQPLRQPKPSGPSGHCWHDTGLMRASVTPQHEVRCCYCGHVAWRKGEYVRETAHGPYNPDGPTYRMRVVDERAPGQPEITGPCWARIGA